MRKFALILLRDIIKGRNSLVHKGFAPFLQQGDEDKIKAIFEQKPTKPDDDINVSVDQTENLTTPIARETSTSIRQHRDEYVIMTESEEVKLWRSLLQNRNIGTARESADIQYNIPEIFVD